MTGLDNDARNKALKRPVSEWMAMYIELIESSLKRIEKDNSLGAPVLYENFKNITRPRLIKVGKLFQKNGLALDSTVVFRGCRVININAGQVIWDNQSSPRIDYFWEDGHKLTLTGDMAIASLGFFHFFQQHQAPFQGGPSVREGQSRIINPGDAEHTDYMRAKAEDQKKGLEL